MAILVAVTLGLVGCGGDDGGTAPPPVPDDPIEQMVVAFDGDPDPVEVRRLVDEALRLYGLPANDDYRSRVGDVLVTMSNEFSIPEMEILQCTIDSYVSGVDLELPEAIALAANFLAAGSC